MPSQLYIDCCVSGYYGEFYQPAPGSDNSNKREKKRRRKIWGKAVYSVSNHLYKVTWDDCMTKVCKSRSFKFQGANEVQVSLPGLQALALAAAERDQSSPTIITCEVSQQTPSHILQPTILSPSTTDRTTEQTPPHTLQLDDHLG
eukprot:6704807-Ditylum_brightwellii.AAC.1